MSAPPRITCLFFTAPTIASFLNSAAGRPFAGDLLIECSLRPTLSFVLNLETPANYPGIAGLLGGVDISSLAHPTERLPAPIVLAPGTPVSNLAARSALLALRRPDERIRALTLLVPVTDVPAYGAALALADRFAVAWDAADFPHAELVDFAAWIATEKIIIQGNFAGLFPYVTETQEPAHARRMRELLATFAARIPHLGTEILSISRS